MNIIEQWIKDNGLGNVFKNRIYYKCLQYKNIILVIETNGGFITSAKVDTISEFINNQIYNTIEEVLFVIDESGIFKYDLKWKMIITVLKERNK